MKKLLILLLLSAAGFAQQSDRHTVAQLTSTCANANSTCDTPGVTVFGQQGDVLGPQSLEVNVLGYGLATVTVSGTYNGSTIFFEFSDDGGTTWYPTTCARIDASVQEGNETLTNNGFRSWDCGVGASTRFRVRQSAITSGGPNVGITLTSGIIEPAPTVALTIPPSSFSIISNPAAGSQATISQAAGGVGVRNVATQVCFAAGSIAAVGAVTALTVNLRDGATGAGTIKWTQQIVISTTPGQNAGPFCTPVR